MKHQTSVVHSGHLMVSFSHFKALMYEVGYVVVDVCPNRNFWRHHNNNHFPRKTSYYL